MSKQDLNQSQAASSRAKTLMASGEYDRAFEAYREAAEYMRLFAQGETGQRQETAYQLTQQLIQKVVQARDEAARKRLKDIVSRADIIAPTLEEGRQITGETSLGGVLRALRGLGPRVIALTMDKDGAALCIEDQVILAEAAPVQEVDPTGAGDTFAAALCVGLREGMEPKHLAMFCNAAGALAVTKRGAIGMALPTREEVDALVNAGACRMKEIALSQV